MELKGSAAAQRALSRPDPTIRLYVLGGPDESGSRAQSDLLARAMGSDAERVDLSAARLKEDPARLADEAASISLFGGARWISVTLFQGGGDDVLAAAENLLAAAAAGNPVVITGAGITGKSRLAKLAKDNAAAVLSISYPPSAEDAARIIEQMAEPLGLSLSRDVSHAIVAATSGDRGLMAREIEKLALYCDADPASPAKADRDAWAAIGADLPEEDVGDAVNIILDGRTAELPALFALLEATGTSDIRLVRALATRAILLARLRVGVEQGQSVRQVMESAGKAIFWKETPAVSRQLGKWDAAKVARLLARLHQLERDLKAPDNAGTLLLRAGLSEMARAAAAR